MVKASYNEKTGEGMFKTKCANGTDATRGIIGLLVYVLRQVDEHTKQGTHKEVLRLVGECMDAIMEESSDEAQRI